MCYILRAQDRSKSDQIPRVFKGMMLSSKLQNTKVQSTELDASENLWTRRHNTWFYTDGQDILVKELP